MKRFIGLILVLILAMGCCGISHAEGQKAPDYILEGFDGESSTRNWETNLFFERMEEKTGISFQFREYTSYSSWQERKRAIGNGEDLPDVLFKAELNAGEIRDMYEAGILTAGLTWKNTPRTCGSCCRKTRNTWRRLPCRTAQFPRCLRSARCRTTT